MRASIIALIITASFNCLAQSGVQEKVAVTGPAFKIIATDSAYQDLASKLPQMVCNGILYQSKLSYTAFPRLDHLISVRDFALQYDYSDASKYADIKQILDEKTIPYLLYGEVNISGDRFFLNVYASNFKDPLIRYESQPERIEQLQKIIDEACESLNFQVRLQRSGKKPKTVLIRNFNTTIHRTMKDRYERNHYDGSFPSRYLEANLFFPPEYIVVKTDQHGLMDQRFLSAILPNPESTLTPDFIITGNQQFDAKAICTITPTIKFGKDSVNLRPVSGSIDKKDILLGDILSTVQTFVNAVVKKGGIDFLQEIRTSLNDVTEEECETEFENAFNAGDKTIAALYADQLAMKFKEKYNRSNLYKGRIAYSDGSYSAAQILFLLSRSDMRKYKDNRDSTEVNYYLGAVHSKIGRYQLAKKYLGLTGFGSAFQDINFLYGYCLYQQDSVDKALTFFNNQLQINEKAAPEARNYAGLCYRALKDWANAGAYIEKTYREDSTNAINKKYMYEFLYGYGMSELNAGRPTTACILLLRGYNISKRAEDLYAALDAAVDAGRTDQEILSMIELGIKNGTLAKSTVYRTLARQWRSGPIPGTHSSKERLQKATVMYKESFRVSSDQTVFLHLGATFLDLFQLDSAAKYYKLAVEYDPNFLSLLDYSELLIIQFKPQDAKFNLNLASEALRKEARYQSKVRKDAYQGLLYFYTIVAKVMTNQSYEDERQNLQKIVRKYQSDHALLFTDIWIFVTFSETVRNDDRFTPAMKKKILDELCLLQPVTLENLKCQMTGR